MKDKTLVTFLLDRTGSMQSIKPATIEAFNAYLAELRKGDGIDFNLITFDTAGIDKVHFEADPKLVPDLTDKTYQPRFGTNLIDAAVITINAVDQAVARKEDRPKVVICIQTDGEENSSTKHTWEQLKRLIEIKQSEGWQFNFMGAGIDAYQQAARMGVTVANTMSYDSSSLAATRNSFAAHAQNTVAYAAGVACDTSYSAEQKASSGDKFVPPVTTGYIAPASVGPVGLDLTGASKAPVTKTSHTVKHPTALDLTQ